MAVFRVFVGAGSKDEVADGIAELSRLAEGRAGTEFHGSWRRPRGTYVVIGGPRSEVVDVIENAGLEPVGVSEVSADELVNRTFALPADDVWCPRHHAYHAPPPHSASR